LKGEKGRKKGLVYWDTIESAVKKKKRGKSGGGEGGFQTICEYSVKVLSRGEEERNNLKLTKREVIKQKIGGSKTDS